MLKLNCRGQKDETCYLLGENETTKHILNVTEVKIII